MAYLRQDWARMEMLALRIGTCSSCILQNKIKTEKIKLGQKITMPCVYLKMDIAFLLSKNHE